MSRKPRRRQGTGPPSRDDLARLRDQASAARLELGQLRDGIAQAQHDSAGAVHLQQANEQLVLSALQSQSAGEDCREKLRVASSAAQRDPLTGLPNRVLLLDRLVHAIRHARRNSERLALLFVDLDGFKQVNDVHGHAAGDSVLQQVAQRLLQVVREEDTVSRHGGDEFLILLAGIGAQRDAVAVADAVIQAFVAPLQWEGVEVALGISVGIAVFPDHGVEARHLIESADAAMYVAKRSDGHCALAGADTALGQIVASPLPGSAPSAESELELRRVQRHQDLLRDANERLVLAALDCQHSQEAAEAAHRLQCENLAVVAHELRGPLSPIQYAAATLPGLPPEELRRVQGVIERGVQQLARLVGDLLDLSRVHTGKLRLERVALDLVGVLGHAVDSARPLLAARSQNFSVEIRADALPVSGDAVRLHQVFRNLLDNAAKYTPTGGWIRLIAGIRCGMAEVIVADSGIGIPLAALDRVFQPFSQEERAVRFDGKGLGIGLTVVRELVEGHDGTVVACSDGPNRGSSFVVTLPLAIEKR